MPCQHNKMRIKKSIELDFSISPSNVVFSSFSTIVVEIFGNEI